MRVYWTSIGLLTVLLCRGTFAQAQTNAAFTASTTSAISDLQRKSLQDLANDLPQLGVYRAANAALPPAKGHTRVVFFGDSLTQAWGSAANGSSFFPGKGYLNRGISGQTSLQMLARFRQDVIDLHPAVVVILAGTNDFAGNLGPASPATVADNLQSMVELARANHIHVVLCSVLPTSGYRWRADARPVEAIRALNTWMKDFAARSDLTYVDYYSAVATPDGALRPEWTHDGVHLNAAGYSVLAPLAETGITAALKRP